MTITTIPQADPTGELTNMWRELDFIAPGFCTLTSAFTFTEVLPPDPRGGLHDIGFDSSTLVWMIGGLNYLYTSTDRVTWVERSLPLLSGVPQAITSLDSNNAGTWIANCNLGNDIGIWRSVDIGVTWAQVVDFPVGRSGADVLYTNGVWAVVVNDGAYISTDDGLTWAVKIPGWGHETIASDGKGTITIAKLGQSYSLDNGVTWSSGGLRNVGGNMFGGHYYNGLWMMAGNDREIITSADGITWVIVQAIDAGTPTYRTVTYNATIGWIVSGDAGYYQISPDGITWGPVQQLGTTTAVIESANGCLVACDIGTGLAAISNSRAWIGEG